MASEPTDAAPPSPLAEALPLSIDELMSRDPFDFLKEPEARRQVVEAIRRQRAVWDDAKAKGTKMPKASGAKAPTATGIADLGLE